MPGDDYHYGRYYSPNFSERWSRRLLANWRGDRPWALLKPFGALYGLGAGLRRNLYGSVRLVEKAPVPVISVGNLTVGGSGKTPLCLALASLLIAEGRQPAVLSRGYGRKNIGRTDVPLVVSRGRGPEGTPAESGDEPWLMAEQLPGLKVVVDANRARAARTAVEHLEADILILDDGFQHLGLAADCRILLIPARNPFGNGAVLPAGPLREPLRYHTLADLLISTGDDRPAPEVVEMAAGRPVFAAQYRSTGWRRLGADSGLLPPEALAGKRVLAFCGLGRPESFENSLKKLGLDIRYFAALADHQIYAKEVMNGLGLSFMTTGAEVLVTTAKDAVKLPKDFPFPIMVLQMEMELRPQADFLPAVLRIARK